MISDGFRTAIGTLTVVRVTPPRHFDRGVTGVAMVVAPLAVMPLGVVVGLTVWLGGETGLSSLVVATLAIGLLVLGSRAFHLDGLADTADALTCSYDRERSLEVMRTGDTGPAGAAAIVLVLVLQIGALSALVGQPLGWLVAGVLVCGSRAIVAGACMRGVPVAREGGLGPSFGGTVAPLVTALVAASVMLVVTASFAAAGLPWWQGPVAVLVAVAAAGALLIRAVKRFGGLTGDTFGAAIEISLAMLLVVASA